MSDVIVDTSVWVNAARGIRTAQTDRLRMLIAARTVGITDIVYGEVRVGTPNPVITDLFERFVAEDRVVRVVSHDDFELAIECCRRSERIGTPVRSITDCLIAAVCIREQLPLLHDDGDFDVLARCTDLQVVPV